MRTLITTALLSMTALVTPGCDGGDTDGIAPDGGRNDCEQSCFEVELRPCRDTCDETFADDDVARDACIGECIGDYDACVADNCT